VTPCGAGEPTAPSSAVAPIDVVTLEPGAALQTAALSDSLNQAVQLLREVLEGIHEAYVEPVSVESLLQAALKGVHDQLDPYTKVLSADEYQAVRSRQGAAVGIGITLGTDGGRTRIRSVRPGSPAERAGLLPGDQLLAVNGVAVRAADLEATTNLLRGTLGSVVHLSVSSPEQGPRAIAIQRETVTRDALTEHVLRGGRVGYLQIHRFARGVADRIETTLTAWASQGVDGVILDLRDNPGGFIDEAVSTAELLLPVGSEIVRTVGRLPEENGLSVSRREPIAACPPLVLLVDSLTASSAEILAGALKGQPSVTLLGEPTYGKRTVQRLVPLSNGGALKVTASFYCTPSDPEFVGDSPAPPQVSASAESGGATLPELTRTHSLHARGRRVEPDRRMEHTDPADTATRLENLGLLSRFSAEKTMSAQDCALPNYWASSQPPTEGGDPEAWIGGFQNARGFDRWCSRLRARLREWGCVEDLPATPALRRAWFADWVTERWGAQAGELVALELDPWIGAAVETIDAWRFASEASARASVTSRR
jgi:carboxyl-terminal processing protease